MAKLPTDIKALARVHTESAINVLASIMNCLTAPESSRVTAAQALLDRGWGKPTQAVEISGELASKVIRAPAIAKSPESWADLHVPPHLKQEVLN